MTARHFCLMWYNSSKGWYALSIWTHLARNKQKKRQTDTHIYKFTFYVNDQLFLCLKTYDPYKTKHTLTIRSSNHTPWNLPKGIENLGPHKNMHTDVFTAFFIIAQTWKQSIDHHSVGE